MNRNDSFEVGKVFFDRITEWKKFIEGKFQNSHGEHIKASANGRPANALFHSW